ncbi:MAG: hypothetical protein Q9213_003878 [Squamulea squamosa]
MSTIFEDAGRTLNTTSTPRPLQANVTRIRMPFSTTSSSRKLTTRLSLAEDSTFDDMLLGKENLPPLGGSVPDSPTSPQPRSGVPAGVQFCENSFRQSTHVPGPGCYSTKKYMGRQPIGIGIRNPIENRTLNESTNQRQVAYPDLAHEQPSTRHSQPGIAAEQIRSGSNQDSPIVGIQRWLTQIPDDGGPQEETPQNERQVSRIESESPSSSPSRAPLASKRDHSWTPPIIGHGKSCRGLTRLPHPLAPSRFLSAPPKPKAHLPPPMEDGSPTGLDHLQFDVFEDESSDELVELSPMVEKYRKGSRPKRDRCVSYWDDDVLPGLGSKTQSPKPVKSDRQPLREMPELTRAKGFMDGVERTEFDFNIQLNAPEA